MIKLCQFAHAIQLPNQVGSTATWNRNTHGGTSRIERTERGIEIVWGKKNSEGRYEPGNETMLIPWTNVLCVTEERVKEQKK